MRPDGARLVALVLAAWLAGCVRHVDAIALDPTSAAAVRAAPRITVVHYQEHVFRSTTRVSVSAPAARIKRRFLSFVSAQLGAMDLRDWTAPRFAYYNPMERYGDPPVYAPAIPPLRRTFERGLVLDVYAPALDGAQDRLPMVVLARLVRLDDGAVLWARTCRFSGAVANLPASSSLDADPETVLTVETLEAADRCATELADEFVGALAR